LIIPLSDLKLIIIIKLLYYYITVKVMIQEIQKNNLKKVKKGVDKGYSL